MGVCKKTLINKEDVIITTHLYPIKDDNKDEDDEDVQIQIEIQMQKQIQIQIQIHIFTW